MKVLGTAKKRLGPSSSILSWSLTGLRVTKLHRHETKIHYDSLKKVVDKDIVNMVQSHIMKYLGISEERWAEINANWDKRRVIRTIGNNETDYRAKVNKILGKTLSTKHPIHHVNLIRSDNTNNNLVICEDNKYHMLLHTRTEAYNACGNAHWRKCAYCGKHDDPVNLYIHVDDKVVHHKACASKYSKERRINKMIANYWAKLFSK